MTENKAELTGSAWHSSSYSANGGAQCVEVATLSSVHGVRDSKHPHQAALYFPCAEWAAFLAAVKREAL